MKPPDKKTLHVMHGEVRRHHGELHNAVESGELEATVKSGARYVGREELTSYCERHGEKPSFLFPEER